MLHTYLQYKKSFEVNYCYLATLITRLLKKAIADKGSLRVGYEQAQLLKCRIQLMVRKLLAVRKCKQLWLFEKKILIKCLNCPYVLTYSLTSKLIFRITIAHKCVKYIDKLIKTVAFL